MTNKKWLVRGGALLVMLGFVLPTMTVSCGGLAEYGRTVSLYDLTTLTDSSLLYLVPLGAVVVMILAFLTTSDRKLNLYFYWGQVAGAALGFLGMLLALSTLRSQFGEIGFDISPEIGSLVLAAGYGLIAVGLVMEWSDVMTVPRVYPGYSIPEPNKPTPGWSPPAWKDTSTGAAPHPGKTTSAPTADHQAGLRDDRHLPASGSVKANLQLIEGNLPNKTIPLYDNFRIGRGSGSDLLLEDRSVSRQHARVRHAQGAWFIQDEQSTAGIYVNEKLIAAKRLDDGDRIRIGNYLFVYRES
jgi:hypothetical protein